MFVREAGFQSWPGTPGVRCLANVALFILVIFAWPDNSSTSLLQRFQVCDFVGLTASISPSYFNFSMAIRDLESRIEQLSVTDENESPSDSSLYHKSKVCGA